MSEQRLASRDIVITTYDVMNTEIHRARPARSGSLRHEKIYKIELSHIMKICWWRVCLDEVQMVDTAGNSSSGKAEMARIIHRVNSWGVSGTPMTGGYEELVSA